MKEKGGEAKHSAMLSSANGSAPAVALRELEADPKRRRVTGGDLRPARKVPSVHETGSRRWMISHYF